MLSLGDYSRDTINKTTIKKTPTSLAILMAIAMQWYVTVCIT